jgi:hypothetical protein
MLAERILEPNGQRPSGLPVLSENSNLASCRQLVLMDESAQPVVSTYPSWTATVLSVPTVRSSYHS